MIKKWSNPKEIITNVEYEKIDGYLYFVDKDGDLSRTCKSAGHNTEHHLMEKVAKLGIQKKRGHWYYPDGKGHIIDMILLPSTRRPIKNEDRIRMISEEMNKRYPLKPHGQRNPKKNLGSA